MKTARGREGRANIVILTGLSGAGKSTAAKVFEDIGYYCVDNVPPILLPKIVDEVVSTRGDETHIAMGVDVRGKDFFSGMEQVIEKWRKKKNDVKVLFFDASDDELVRRFSETRRVHPVAALGTKEAIRKEREILSKLREMSDEMIDTSRLTVHELRDSIVKRFSRDGDSRMQISVISFGFRYGLPQEADMVLDVRFLPNPYFVPALKRFTGLDARISDYVLKGRVALSFMRHVKSMLQFLLPLYRKEGKAYFTIAIGCTGGKHRSVAVAAALGNYLCKEDKGVVVTHRDAVRLSSPAREAK